MDVQQDFIELLALFNALHVKYIIVGGYALAFHGAPRMTGDIDILTSLTGVSWEKAYATKKKGKYGELSVFFISRELLLKNTRSVGRKKDRADLEALGE